MAILTNILPTQYNNSEEFIVAWGRQSMGDTRLEPTVATITDDEISAWFITTIENQLPNVIPSTDYEARTLGSMLQYNYEFRKKIEQPFLDEFIYEDGESKLCSEVNRWIRALCKKRCTYLKLSLYVSNLGSQTCSRNFSTGRPLWIGVSLRVNYMRARARTSWSTETLGSPIDIVRTGLHYPGGLAQYIAVSICRYVYGVNWASEFGKPLAKAFLSRGLATGSILGELDT